MAFNVVKPSRPAVAPLMSYVYGEEVPLPEVLEKNTDSVWALFAGELSDDSVQRDTVLMQPDPLTTPSDKDTSGNPRLVREDSDDQTRRMPLEELPGEAGIDKAIAIIEERHGRIAQAIRTMWGTPECVEYMEKLIVNCGDEFRSRAGFPPQVVSAMLSLVCLHPNAAVNRRLRKSGWGKL